MTAADLPLRPQQKKGSIMLILGLLILIGAGVVGTAGVLSNRGGGHALPGGFDVLGHTVHGSTGQLFLWGIALGAAAVVGLMLVLVGLRHEVKRRGAARRDARWRRKGEQAARPAPAAEPEPEPAAKPAAAVPVAPEAPAEPSESDRRSQAAQDDPATV
jgi:hypothetical protein